MYGTPGAMNPTPSGGTAKTLILIGLVLQLIFALIFLLALGALAFLAASIGGVFPIFSLIYIVFGILGFIFLYLIWTMSYKPVTEGKYEQAKTPTLIFAILSLIFSGIIPGVLYLIAYVKLGDAVREQQMPPGYPGGMAPMMAPNMPYGGQPGMPMQQPMSPMPPATAPAAPASVMCPKCGKPATFVPQYNRYYCYTDQQYV